MIWSLDIPTPLALLLTDMDVLVQGAVGFAVSAAAAFVVLALATSVARFHMIMVRSRESRHELPPREHLLLQLADRMAVSLRARPAFALLLAQSRDEAGASTGEGADRLYAALRAALRQQDLVLKLEDHTVAALVACAPESLFALLERLRLGALGAAGKTMGSRLGVTFYPGECSSAAELFAASRHALEQAWDKTGSGDWVCGQTLVEAGPKVEETSEQRTPAHIDPVTGVLKADRVRLALQKFVAFFRRTEKPVSVALLRIHGLDRYEAHYGEEAANAVLREVSKVLLSALREDDFIARWGGDGFVLGLPCTVDAIPCLGRRLMDLLRQVSVEHKGHRLRAAGNMGFANCPAHASLPRDVIHQAGEALERATEKGVNVWRMPELSDNRQDEA